jgi:Fe-S cluster biogenesis protein NfuA
MEDLDRVLERLEALVGEVEGWDDPMRARVFELLDCVDDLHRFPLVRLAEVLGPRELERLRADPIVGWLLDAYGAGVDERAAANSALDEIRPYIHSHGGDVEILDVTRGVVRVRMSGACSGCTASAITLREGVEEALRDHFPAFAGLQVEPDESPAHPPPGPTLLQIRRPASG